MEALTEPYATPINGNPTMNDIKNYTSTSLSRRNFISMAAGLALAGTGGLPAAAAENPANRNIKSGGQAFTILFTGTGAADWPATYPKPDEPFERGMFRGNASALVNGSLLIDCGPTVCDSLVYHGIDIAAIDDILITHSHGDHISAKALGTLISKHAGSSSLRIWVEKNAVERIPPVDGAEIKPLVIGERYSFGSVSVIPLAANHLVQGSPETALHYLVENAGKRIFYATDGAWLPKPTWLALKETTLDAIIWDATIGDTDGDWRIFEHNSIAMIRLMMETLIKQGVASGTTHTLLTHMALTLCSPHAELERKLAPENIVPAYDGMLFTLPV